MTKRREIKKTERFETRCSVNERKDWAEKAAASGRSLSAFVRDILNTSRPPIGIQLPREFLRGLSAQGNNLNQLARYANTYADEADARAILEALEAVRSELEKIANSVEGGKKRHQKTGRGKYAD